jgi:hypothetical protein
LIADASAPELGIEVGDVISLEPGSPEPVLIHREAPTNYGAILDAIEVGALRPLHPREPVIACLERAHRQGKYAPVQLVKGGAP